MSNQEMAITNYSLATVWDRELKGDHLKGTLACMDETCGNQTRKANLLLPSSLCQKGTGLDLRMGWLSLKPAKGNCLPRNPVTPPCPQETGRPAARPDSAQLSSTTFSSHGHFPDARQTLCRHISPLGCCSTIGGCSGIMWL